MAKLDTTIDNLERKTSKVTGTVPSSSWTDAQYPSAKTLYNTYNKLLTMMHPVGSIYITSTNTNPSSTLGGTWELVDKSFRNAYISVSDFPWHSDTNYATLGSNSTVALVDHSINMRLMITPTVDLSDTTMVLGSFVLENYGITRLHYTEFQGTAHSDGGQCVVNYTMDMSGNFSINDILNIDGTHTMEAGETFYANIQEEIPHNYMLDSACDKFYWKRTA
jgi:hypothetical protein